MIEFLKLGAVQKCQRFSLVRPCLLKGGRALQKTTLFPKRNVTFWKLHFFWGRVTKYSRPYVRITDPGKMIDYVNICPPLPQGEPDKIMN